LPTLAILARRYLAIPATSAPSESIFSIAGDTITKKRNKLSDESFRRLIVLKNWGEIDNEKDTEESEEES